MFETAEINQSLKQVEEIELFTSDLESFKFHNTTNTLLDSEQAIIYYIAGYIAKSLTKAKCIAHRTLVSPGKVDMPFKAKDEFIASVSREVYQSLLIIFILHLCMHHLCIVLFLIMKTYKIPWYTKSKKNLYRKLHVYENDEYTVKLMSIKCEKGHNHSKNLCRVAFTIFDNSAKNDVSEVKDKLRESKKNKDKYKQSKSAKKIKKLQSN